MKNSCMALVACALAMLPASLASAQLVSYSQNFEALDINSPTALSDNGWKVFANRFSPPPANTYLGGYGPDPAPNPGAGFSSIATGDGGPSQGLQYLNVYSDYGNQADQTGGVYLDSLVFQEQTIGVSDGGKTATLTFDYRSNPANGPAGDSTTFAFIKVLKQSDFSFAELGVAQFNTTSAAGWQTQSISIEINSAWAGELVQFGFRSYATNNNSTGRFYDNISFSATAPPPPGPITVTVDPSANWLGYMNVFEILPGSPRTKGNFVFGSAWGFADLTASFDLDDCLNLGVNTIGDPNSFWYTPSGGPGALGNKWMDANGYVEHTNSTTYSGVTVTFTGTVKSNTFTNKHTATAFIRDFAPDFSTFVETSVVLTPGVFSISLATLPGPGRHVQYGFNVQGENVWVTDAASFGKVVVGEVSEPVAPQLVAARPYHDAFPGLDGPVKVDTSVSLIQRGPGVQLATLSNIISSSQGINGVVLDFDQLSALGDISLEYKMSPTNVFADPIASWPSAPAPTSTTLLADAGEAGSDRVLIKWTSGSIANRYLCIKVIVGGSTIAELYLGHLKGEMTGGNGTVFSVSYAADLQPIRTAVGTAPGASGRPDVDKNNQVQLADIVAMRTNAAAQLSQLSVPALP